MRIRAAAVGTQDIYNGFRTSQAGATLPASLQPVARRKLDMLSAAATLSDLRTPPGNRLEKLSGDREGQHSIRINEKYRICFRWENAEAVDVEIVDYH